MPLGRRRPVMRDAAIVTVAHKRGERSGEEAAGEAQAAAPPPPPPQAPPPAGAPADSTSAQINELVALHASGALTDDEFAAAKAKALGIG
jgi:hypothetical protein